jgi:glyoxylase-like metal-dependent hydrolase (beta-lactamase superfamily II)
MPAPPTGVMQTLAPGIRRIIAPNPSPMTLWGTNTFVLGEGDVTVIDPGPPLPVHYDAILAGLERGERIARILVTHAHIDHSPLARPLSENTGARVHAFGPATAGRSQVMCDLVARGMASGGEGIDSDFMPDEFLGDDDELDIGNGIKVAAIWTPGHLSNHLCFAMNGALFTGDHVMGWASTLISPPDGDVTAFMASCRKLAARRDDIHYPAHGAAVSDPAARLAWLIAHREGREAEILAALAAEPATITTLTRAIYTDTPKALMAAAERNVFAHLIDLTTRDLVRANPSLAANAVFRRI